MSKIVSAPTPVMGMAAETTPGVELSNVTRLFVEVRPITDSARTGAVPMAKTNAVERQVNRNGRMNSDHRVV